MSHFSYEDRTQETPEETADRNALRAAFLLANTANGIHGGDTDMAALALAAALGLTAARSEAPVAEVLDSVRRHYEKAKTALAEYEFHSRHRRTDA